MEKITNQFPNSLTHDVHETYLIHYMVSVLEQQINCFEFKNSLCLRLKYVYYPCYQKSYGAPLTMTLN